MKGPRPYGRDAAEAREAAASRGDSTREALLDAAEALFAREGIEGASLRAITRHAEANLASVHYHFGSKDALVQAVFERRLEPLNQERLARLDRLQGEAGGEPPAVEDVLRAFIEPVMRMLREGTEQQRRANHRLARLLFQGLADPEGPVRAIVLEAFREVRMRFLSAMARALPQLTPAELAWRFHFVVGAMAHTASTGDALEELSGGLCDASDVEAMTDRLVGFLSAGLESPVSAGSGRRPAEEDERPEDEGQEEGTEGMRSKTDQVEGTTNDVDGTGREG